MGKGLSYLKKWGVVVNYCWNKGPLKLLLYFIEYCLDQLNTNHTKIAVNSTISFGPRTTKWCPCKIFAKLNGNHLLMANISKLHKHKTFGLMKMHNMYKSDLPITYSVYGKVWFTMNGSSKMLFFSFCLFPFFQISNYCCQKSYNGFRGFLVVVGGPKNFKLLADISFESSLPTTAFSTLLLFLCACY